MSSDIRVALDLVATTSGVGSIQSLIYALSQLHVVGVDTAALAQRQQQAENALAAAELGLEQATSRVTMAQMSGESASTRVMAARRNLEQANNDLTDATNAVAVAEQNYVSVAANPALRADAQAAVAKAQLAEQTAINTQAAAEESLQIAQNSQAYSTEALNIANLGEEAAQQRVQVANLNEEYIQSQNDAALAGQAAQDALAPIIGIAIAAAAETLVFDAALKTIIGDASAIQYTSSQMNLALHGTQDQMQQLDAASIKWAEDSLYSTAQVHQLLTALAEHGLTTEQILGGVGQAAIQLGEAINTDPVEAANLLASTLQMFSAEGLTATDAANMLTAAFYNGVGSATELQQAFDMAGGQMVAAGGNATDLAANIDLLAQAGLSGSSAGSSLRYVLQSLTAPTAAQAAAMNYLGLSIVNTTSPAFKQLTRELDASGAAGQKAVQGFDGTSVGLKGMFTEAQKLHLIPLNETFNEWAVASGAMSTQFYNAKGQFAGLGNSIADIIDAIQKKAHGNKDLELNLIESMFNVRSGRAVGILASMTDYKNRYNKIVGEIGKTSVSKDATSLLDTLNGRWHQLQTTFASTAGQAGQTILPMLTNLAVAVNNLLSNLQKNNPQLLTLLAIFIAVGAVLAPIVVIIGGIIILFATFSEVLVPLGIALAVIPLIAGLVAGAIQQVHTKGTFLYNLFQTLGPIIQQVGNFLQQLGGVWTNQIFPAFAQALPVLKIIGIILGVVIVAAIVIVIAAFLLVAAVVTGAFLVIGLAIQGIGWLFSQIPAALTLMVNEAKAIWNTFVYIVSTAWHNFTAEITFAVNYVKQYLTYSWSAITAGVSTAFNYVKNYISATWNTISQGIGNILSKIRATLTSQWNLVTTEVHNVWNGIGNFFGSLVSTAQGWGRNIIQGFINGIKSMTGAVGNAAGGIAGTVKSFLGFHSPAEEGPGADADKWAPNFMRMYAAGFTGNIGLVTGAAGQVAGAFKAGIVGGSVGASSSGSGGTQVYNVNVGNQPLFQMVMDQLSGQLKINGFGRQWK